ncbi:MULTISPECIES: peptidoglycan-binding protein [unclassified Streptomyces]|uniref:peptidoglycan-binding domain-containing protein n=1 Tax=unclassified Streptomyces TaxID=2593676 RepID=UPI0037BA9257
MRSLISARTLAGVTVVVAMVGGSLAGTGAAFAAPVPASKPTSVSGEFAVLAVQNFGLSKAEAIKAQQFVKAYWDYNDSIDGKLGPRSWMAFQRLFATHWEYKGAIDGKPGPNTVKAMQRWLTERYEYTGEIDGDAGPLTRAAFKRFANSLV